MSASVVFAVGPRACELCGKLHTPPVSGPPMAIVGLTASERIGYTSDMAFKELDVVRVVALHAAGRPFDGAPGTAREPRVGDVGTVVYVYAEPGMEAVVSVEAVAPDGNMMWAADFAPDELASAAS